MQWKESKKKLNQDKYQIYQIEESINSDHFWETSNFLTLNKNRKIYTGDVWVNRFFDFLEKTPKMEKGPLVLIEV